MPGLFRRKTLAQEDVSQVSSAIIADDFGAPAIRISYPFYCALDFVIERGPPAVPIKLIFGAIEWGIT